MTTPIRLFQAFGVELEYMLVDAGTLDVRPIADEVLRRAAQLPGADASTDEGSNPQYPNEVALGDVSWSNELVLHVLELKTAEPASTLEGVAGQFSAAIASANALLEPLGAMLLPTGMHPWMDPFREMKLWPHDYSPVYQAFNRIFDCRGHGWANLQACHLNLPFHIDEDTPGSEFGRLHAAVRVLLPIMPALSAGTPVMEGRSTGLMDNRLEVYRTNSKKIPAATGMVIPEPVFTRRDYETQIFDPIYEAYRPFDPEGLMRHEWTNSRGAIARFMRDTIEIRVLDVQECPRADLAIVSAITEVVRALVEGRIGNLDRLRAWPVAPLHEQLLRGIREADRAPILDLQYARDLGWSGSGTANAAEIWHALVDAALGARPRPEWYSTLMTILSEGCLARRILRAIGPDPTRGKLAGVYRGLSRCLARNELFRPA